MGSLYQRGNIWWIKYYHRGKSYRESSKSESKMIASYLLKQREGEITEGKVPSLVYERTRFKDLSKLILDDYRLNKRKSLERVEYSLKHLEPYFKGYAAPEITSDTINQYILFRVNEGAANATINRELSCLKRMLNLGRKYGKVGNVPKITLLTEKNVRKGFFEYDEFVAVRNALPDYLKGFVTFAYKVGWRVGEIINLTWAQVNRRDWSVRIEGDQTKNEEARTIYLDTELKEIFTAQWERRKEGQKVTQYVFPNHAGTGKISDFRWAWRSACEEAGVRRMVHDFRRTASRNLVRAAVPEAVAMKVTGHKTRSVFDRYNIVSDKDLKLAAERLEEYQNFDDRHKLGTIEKMKKKTG